MITFNQEFKIPGPEVEVIHTTKTASQVQVERCHSLFLHFQCIYVFLFCILGLSFFSLQQCVVRR